jgi:SAP domain
MTTYRERHLAGQYQAPDIEEPTGYYALSKPELQAELENRDLPTTGNKPDLIARLEEDDES